MVKLVDKLGFVEWYQTRTRRFGKWAVTRHIEQALREADVPRVPVRTVFIDKHGRGAIQLLSQLCIAPTAEHRTSERIGVDETELIRREVEPAEWVGQLIHMGGKANELGFRHRAKREQAKFIATMDGRKHRLAVLPCHTD